MANQKKYFYLSENPSAVIVSQFFPPDGWVDTTGYLISITSTYGERELVLEIRFASRKVIKLMADALLELLNTEKNDISMKAFWADNY